MRTRFWMATTLALTVSVMSGCGQSGSAPAPSPVPKSPPLRRRSMTMTTMRHPKPRGVKNTLGGGATNTVFRRESVPAAIASWRLSFRRRGTGAKSTTAPIRSALSAIPS